jgi:hypothetical protein
MGGIGIGELLLIMLVGAVIAGMIAKSRGAPNVVTWTLLGALFPLFGIIGAALFAKPKASPAGPSAQAAMPTAWGQPQIAPAMTAQPPAQGWGTPPAAPGLAPAGGTEFCPKCGNARIGAFRFCRSCGFDFEAPLA